MFLLFSSVVIIFYNDNVSFGMELLFLSRFLIRMLVSWGQAEYFSYVPLIQIHYSLAPARFSPLHQPKCGLHSPKLPLAAALPVLPRIYARMSSVLHLTPYIDCHLLA